MGKLSVFLVIAIIFVALFGATGVFAYSPEQLNNGFTPFPWVQSSTRPDSSVFVDSGFGPVNNVNYYLGYGTTVPNVYWAQVHYGSNWQCYAFCDTQISALSYYNTTLDRFSTGNNFYQAYYDNGTIATGVYYNQIVNAEVVSVPVQFSSFDEALSAFVEFKNSGFSSSVGEVINFTIPTGYALLIQGSCDILERDYAIYNSWNFYQNDARRVNGSRERVISTCSIVDGFSFDHNLTYSQSIQWIPRNANLFGSSSNYEYSDHTSLSISSGSTFLISNPQYIGTMENVGNVQTKENTVPLTGTIYFEYTTRPTIKYIALESQIDFNQVGVYYNVFRPDVYEEIASTTVDGTDVIVSPDYTGTTVPPDGGNSGQPPYNPDETVEGVLSNFINNIRSLISSATQAISDLVNTGSSFMQSISTMFTWLPSPLLSVIIGGLTILVVVGVLKVLWR